MSHHIYTTPGFVVESYPHGEAGKFIYIFTRDLGMVAGVAQGIRLSQSKLRYHAQDFSLANFSLVRGKEVWRIVGAEKVLEPKNLSELNKLSPLFVRVLKVLKRLVTGEEKNEELFEVLLAAHDFLHHISTPQNTEVRSAESPDENAEYIIMLRILHKLGYIREVPALQQFLVDTSLSPELLITMTSQKTAAVKEINAALKESHL